MDKVLLGPFVVILVHTPLFIDIEQGEMVTLWDLEMLSGSIALLFTVLWPEEY